MEKSKLEFGGYLPLELPRETGAFFGALKGFDVLELNSGRSAFFHAAKHSGASKIYLPHFTCPETAEPFQAAGLGIGRYHLAEDLTPEKIAPEKDALVLWTNYYGNATDEVIDRLVRRFDGRLILDNCHAFFSKPRAGAYNVYSARKFFGVADGAYLIANALDGLEDIRPDTSYDSMKHLLIQHDLGTHAGYPANLENEKRLTHKFAGMSAITHKLVATIDYPAVLAQRTQNLGELHVALRPHNLFEVHADLGTQMYYPFLHSDSGLRTRLLKSKIYSPTWWAHVAVKESGTGSVEERLSRDMVMLPIDQRYGESDMKLIAQIVLQAVGK